MRLPLLVAVAAGLAVFAAPADARKFTYGSDLSAPATISHSKPNDSVYWNESLASGHGYKVTVKGQVIAVKIKGRIVPSEITLSGGGNPFNTIHFQVLRKRSNGRYQVRRFGTSTDYQLPWAGSDDRITTFHTTRKNDALCVKPGDRVDFATLGGFDPAHGYPNGTPFRTFASVPGSTVHQYSAAGTEGVGNEQVFKPQNKRKGQELLMQFVVGTGKDSRAFCLE
jgi:hypothetical protein